MKKYVGVIPPIITPIDEHENVDERGLRHLIRVCISNGIHGIFVAGSNGETMALTQEQRNRAIQITIDEVNGACPVLCGVMDSSTRRVIDNLKALEDIGGTAAVITPVFYARHATQYETVRHFEEIAKHTNMDLLIYNIPMFTGQKLTAETVFEIAAIDNVAGYKDTSGSLPDFIKCLEHFRGTDFCLLQGSTNLSAASLLMGADGYVPSLAPLYPEPYIKMYEAGVAGNIEETMRWNEVIAQTCRIYPAARSQTSSTKYAMSKLGLISPQTILPNEPITKNEMAAIDAIMTTLTQYMARV